MNKIHFILQGKGGVGKSVIASILAQYHMENGLPVQCIDTDPVNATLGGYQTLPVSRIELVDKDQNVNARQFDTMMERLVAEETNFVIDNGASSFLPLSNYLIQNDAIRLLGNMGKQVVLHTVITGGQAIRDTATGFKSLAENLPEGAGLIVWLNEYFGKVAYDGKSFEEMKVYLDNRDKVHGIVRITEQPAATFGEDIRLMLESKLTFQEAVTSPSFGFMAKQRLSMVRGELFRQIGLAV